MAVNEQKEKSKDIPKQHTLHEMRKISGISGSTVARLCNTTYQSLRNWEDGETIPNIVVIHDLLRIYGFTYEQLDLTPFFKVRDKRVKKKKKLDMELDHSLRKRIPLTDA